MTKAPISKRKLEEWVATERANVESYLKREKVEHLGVGDWPAYSYAPNIAIWAIQSKIKPGFVGWWAISGDCPTDYMSRGKADHPRKAVSYFAKIWRKTARLMSAGKPNPELKIGKKKEWATLAPLLKSRSEFLDQLSRNEIFWKEFDK